MTAPSFVAASTGSTDAGGAWTATCHAPGAAGRIIILHMVQDGTSLSSATLDSATNIQNLAGTNNAWTQVIWGSVIGDPAIAYQRIWIGRSTGTSAPTATGSNSTSEDLYWRFYEFQNVSTGTTLAEVIENGASNYAEALGTSGTISAVDVTTNGPDRLSLQLVGINDDNAAEPFAGETGGTWTEAAEYAESSGTDATIQLQLGYPNIVSTSLVPKTGSYSRVLGTVGSEEKYAQSFTVPNGTTLIGVRCYVLKAGTPTDNLILEIQTDSGGLPSGTVVGTGGSISASSIAGGKVYVPINATVDEGATYWLVFSRSGARDQLNYFRINHDDSSWSGGVAKLSDSGNWAVANQVDDALFALTSVSINTEITITGGTFTNVDATDGWGVFGFALKPAVFTARRSAQAQAKITIPYGFAQVQAYIKAIAVKSYGQSQARILNVIYLRWASFDGGSPSTEVQLGDAEASASCDNSHSTYGYALKSQGTPSTSGANLPLTGWDAGGTDDEWGLSNIDISVDFYVSTFPSSGVVNILDVERDGQAGKYRLTIDTTGSIVVYAWDTSDTVWVGLGGAGTVSTDTWTTIKIRCRDSISSNPELHKVYVKIGNNTEASFDSTGLVGVPHGAVCAVNLGTQIAPQVDSTFWFDNFKASVADFNETRILKNRIFYPTSDGTYTSEGWTGTYTNVDDLPPNSSDGITINDGNNAKFTVKFSPTELSNHIVSVRPIAISSTSVPASTGGLILYSNSQLYIPTTGKNMTTFPRAIQFNLEKNPITGIAWTFNDVTQLEVGMVRGASTSGNITVDVVYIDVLYESKWEVFGQAQATITAGGLVTYRGYSQAQAQIKAFAVKSYAQSQAQIKQTYIGYAQSQAQVKQTYRGYAQTLAKIKATYQSYAQSLAHIKSFNIQSYAQAQTTILAATATRYVHAQAQTHIKTTYRGYAQAQTWIKTTAIKGYSQAQTWIKITALNSFAQTQAQIKITTQRFAQAQAQIKGYVQAYAQTQAHIKVTSKAYAQAQTDIKTTYRGYSQAQAWIEQAYSGYAQAQAYIKQTFRGSAQAQAQVKTAYQVVAQSQAQIRQTYRGFANAQAQVKQSYLVYAQAQARITFIGKSYAQSQVLIKTSYIAYAQAQANTRQTYRGYAQGQAQIKQTYLGQAQAQGSLRQINYTYAQAQALVYIPVYYSPTADITNNGWVRTVRD